LYTASHDLSSTQPHSYLVRLLIPSLMAQQDNPFPTWSIGQAPPQGWRAWAGRPALPYEIDLGMHQGVILGATEIGTNASMQRIAFNAASHGWKVFLFDAQGSQEEAVAFYAAMQQAGRQQVYLFPGDAYNGWQGTGNALLHRLLQISPSREPYYQHIAIAGLASVLLQDDVPHNLDDILSQLSTSMKKRSSVRRGPWEPHHFSPLETVRATDLSGPLLRYHAFSSLVGKSLSGSWSYDQADAAYFAFNAWSRPEEARVQARFLLADLASYLSERVHKKPRVLLLIKHPEYLFDVEQIVPLFAQMERSLGSLFLAVRSPADLGRAPHHVLKNASILLVHRSLTALPFEPYIAFPWWKSHSFVNESLQSLSDQDCFVIARGGVTQVRVAPVHLEAAEIVRATHHYASPSQTTTSAQVLEEDPSIFFLPEDDEEDDVRALVAEIFDNSPVSSEGKAQGAKPALQDEDKVKQAKTHITRKRRTRSVHRQSRAKMREASSDTPPTAPTS